jgi:hypothetical protein
VLKSSERPGIEFLLLKLLDFSGVENHSRGPTRSANTFFPEEVRLDKDEGTFMNDSVTILANVASELLNWDCNNRK